MSDLISRQAAIDECYPVTVDGEVYEVVQVETLMGLPSVQEPKNGKWIKIHWKAYRCSECNRVSEYSTDYCPNCGRRMGVVISAVDSDWARCNCGTNVIFRNQGRRKGWLQAWRDGEVIGK